MRAALLTEGDGEYKTFPTLIAKLRLASTTQFIRTQKVPVSPNSPPAQIARQCAKPILAASALGADTIVLVIDRETSQDSPGDIADDLVRALAAVAPAGVVVKVVIKDQKFENWLIADVDAVAAQPAKYAVTAALRKRVTPNKADHCDALVWLKSAALDRSFDKIQDAQRIIERIDVDRAAENSRSFRHFLHAVAYPKYKSQCRVAA